MIKFHWRSGSWKHFGEYVFEVRQDCKEGCRTFELGFFGFTIYKNNCENK